MHQVHEGVCIADEAPDLIADAIRVALLLAFPAIILALPHLLSR